MSDPAGNEKLAKGSQGGRRQRARDDAAAACWRLRRARGRRGSDRLAACALRWRDESYGVPCACTLAPGGARLDPEMIRLLAMIGNWVAGLGTIAAVGVSLWLALRSEKLRLRVKVDRVRVELEEIRYVRDGQPLSKTVDRDRIIFSVTNRGSRTETIESVGWAHRKGLERASEIVRRLGKYGRPYRLEPGTNHKVVIDTTKAMTPLPESPKWVRGIVHTPMGSKAVRVGPELRKYFREERRAKRKMRRGRNRRKMIPTSSDDEPSAPLHDAPSDVGANPPRDPSHRKRD